MTPKAAPGRRLLSIAGQLVLYALFALALGIFSRYPTYQQLAPDQALLKLSFSHPGQLKAECRLRSSEELARMPRNMRAPMDCSRERSPVTVELDLDAKPLTRAVVAPSGFSKDGASTLYSRFPVSAGPHHLSVRFKDSVRVQGFNYTRDLTIAPQSGQIVVVDFDLQRGGIVVQ